MQEEVLEQPKSLGKGNRTNHPKNHKKVNYDAVINYRISKKSLDKLNEIAKKLNRSAPDIVRELINNFIEKEKVCDIINIDK